MRKRNATFVIVACLGAGIFGVGVGAASAQGVFVNTPAGVSAPDGIDSALAPKPTYKTNAQGLTYGSAAEATSPADEPDLIAVEYEADRNGYVYKKDLDDAQGPGEYATPEEVLKWQENDGQEARSVSVYEVDGKTVIGEFVIAGITSQPAK